MDVLDLICSFPLLEDLALDCADYGSDTWNNPSTSPKLTGSLDLSLFVGVRPTIRRLVGLPNGLRFTKITITVHEDVGSITDLVSRCSDTLESLSIYRCGVGLSFFSFHEWSIPYRYHRYRHVWNVSG
jgi:hypothetical protein